MSVLLTLQSSMSVLLTVLCERLIAHPKCNDITTDLTSRESSPGCVVDRTDRIGQLVVGVSTSSHYGTGFGLRLQCIDCDRSRCW